MARRAAEPRGRARLTCDATRAAVRPACGSGRFNTNTRLCLSMSDFHPETWVPAWSVASILNGVLSFMLESTPTVGSVETSLAERRRLAIASHAFNRKTPIFAELFPQLLSTADQAGSDHADADTADTADADAGGAGGAQAGERPALPAYLLLGGVVALAVGVGYLVREL